MEHLLPLVGQIIVNGLAASSFYVFIALGITIVYGLTGIIVFCQGELLMLGAFIAITVLGITHSFVVALIAAIIGIAVLGLLLERAIFRFTFKEPITGFLISLGLIAVFQNVAQAIWSADPRFTAPFFPRIMDVGGVKLPGQAVFTVVIMIATFIGLYFLLYRLRMGKALRASAEDSEAARIVGVPVSRIVTVVFILGAALAGLGGGLLVPMFSIDPWVGHLYLLKAFAIALIGGLGSIWGTVIVGLLLGIAESVFGTVYLAEWRDAFSLGALILVLLFRPHGLFRGVEGGRVR